MDKIAFVILWVDVALMLIGLVAAVFIIRYMKKIAAESVNYDDMTGLPNREGFMKKGADIVAKASASDNYVLFIFDVERLGMINTMYGHDFGDKVINAFAVAASEVGNGGAVGRVNTDDFAVLTKLQSNTVEGLIDKFESIMASHVTMPRSDDCIRFRVGYCAYDGTDDIYTLYNKANLGLLMRRDNVKISEFTADMESRMIENELLRAEMLEALEKGEFELYYQPKVSFKTNEILGVEALIRWHHPVKGFVPPCDFIPLAEQFGIITKIDEWTLLTACRQAKKWQDKGLPPVKISVNMSQVQFQRTDVFASVSKALEETGLDPEWLEIEVTETMAMTDVDRTVGILDKIHKLGVSISMDDFGTGYSSLASLKAIPFDVLKIDRSLVCDVNENDASRRIAGAIVAMGKALKMVVLAEGVENIEQSKLLTEIGCDLAQGYYYSKPCPSDEIERMLAHSQFVEKAV